MPDIKTYTIDLNGKKQTIKATPDMPLLWVLRQEVGLSGPKFGCGGGFCGACTVHLDGAPVRSCQLPVGELGAGKVTTLEGMAGDPIFEKLRAAWLEIDVMQCGYCQSGQLLVAHALLKDTPKPSADDIDSAMESNICRCATYPKIRQAIAMAAGTEEHHHAG